MARLEPDFGQLKKLWTLRTVVETGNLKRASLRGKVSVSAVSQSITGLERALGRKLFVKQDRHLVPTQYCRQVLASAEPAFRAFTELEALRAAPVCVPSMKWLDFGTSQCVAAELLPRLVKQLKAKLPDLRLKLKVGRCEALVAQVRKGELCMALVAGAPGSDELGKMPAYPIYEDRLGIYVAEPGSGAVVGADRGAFREVAALSPGPDGHPEYYRRYLRALGQKLPATLTCDDYQTIYEIVASGVMPGILPERLATRKAGVLREVREPFRKAITQGTGRFTVQMVSQAGCDPAEDQFLIAELRSLI